MSDDSWECVVGLDGVMEVIVLWDTWYVVGHGGLT